MITSKDIAMICFPQPVFAFPHVLKDMDPETKMTCRAFYRRVKRGFVVGSFAGIAVLEGKDLVMHIVKRQVVRNGYKLLLGVSVYPMTQLISVPFYILTNHKKIKMIGKTLAETGAMILEGEMTLGNVMFLAVDMALFGEPVSITDNSNFSIWGNETAPSLDEIISTFNE
jgi:hypothetical protein